MQLVHINNDEEVDTPELQDDDEEVDNPELQKPPEVARLMSKIGYKALNKWKGIAASLEISVNDIESIDMEQRGNSAHCYMSVFNKWKKATTPPYTWATIIDALIEVGEGDLAVEVKKWLGSPK